MSFREPASRPQVSETTGRKYARVVRDLVFLLGGITLGLAFSTGYNLIAVSRSCRPALFGRCTYPLAYLGTYEVQDAWTVILTIVIADLIVMVLSGALIREVK